MVHCDRWRNEELVQFAKVNKGRGEKASAGLGKSILVDANWANEVYPEAYARKFDAISKNMISDAVLFANASGKAASAATSEFLGVLGINRPQDATAVGEWAAIMTELKNRKLGNFERDLRVRLDRGASIVSIPDAIRAGDTRLDKSILRIIRVRKSTFQKLQYNHDDRDQVSKTVCKEIFAAIALDALMHDTTHATIACLYDGACIILQQPFTEEHLHNAGIDLQHIRFARCICLRLINSSALTGIHIDKLAAIAEPAAAQPKKERPRQFPSANHEGITQQPIYTRSTSRGLTTQVAFSTSRGLTTQANFSCGPVMNTCTHHDHNPDPYNVGIPMCMHPLFTLQGTLYATRTARWSTRS